MKQLNLSPQQPLNGQGAQRISGFQKNNQEIVLDLENLNGRVAKPIGSFENVREGNGICKKKVEEKRLPEFCHQKELCVTKTWFQKKQKKISLV